MSKFSLFIVCVVSVVALSATGVPTNHASSQTEEYWKVSPGKDDRSLDQWNLSRKSGIAIDDYEIDSLGAGIVVAVVDTGVNPHREFTDRMLPGYDFVSDPVISGGGDGRDPDVSDPGSSVEDPSCRDGKGAVAPASWHGTYVYGIIAAENDGAGISGVSPSAKILPVRASGNCREDNPDVADGIIWASGGQVTNVPSNKHVADVIVVSLSESSKCDEWLGSAINFAESNGSSVVLSAGNKGVDAKLSNPTNCGHGISVGASDKNGDMAYYSNWGENVDVWAPGGDVRTRVQDGIPSSIDLSSGTWEGRDGYGYYQGSSPAAPHVAGVIAGMKGSGFDGANDEIQEILLGCSRSIAPEGSARAVPILNAACAINTVKT
ncbi:S8 family serine peptidase [Corynebacterium urogenitale]|uniref:S8 family serine peptidase n=1 Tax=Corynebacterium urogenitale TaxID=2487892 RepID=UPI0013760D2E|nr:S8 family serine peptidase [Corynebacterium urogenitale]